ncbi:hypothetical protein N7454_006689 [Penicillium verhagenii]|nr:hypothetical protein N7454_006689 [Penicillium verhagenii]
MMDLPHLHELFAANETPGPPLPESSLQSIGPAPSTLPLSMLIAAGPEVTPPAFVSEPTIVTSVAGDLLTPSFAQAHDPVCNCPGPPPAVPVFPPLLDENLGPCAQPPARVLFLTSVSSGTTQTVVPATHVANDMEKPIPICDINSFGAGVNEMEEGIPFHDTNSFRAVESGMEERPPPVASGGLEALIPIGTRPTFMSNVNRGVSPPNSHNSLAGGFLQTIIP